MPCTLEAVLGVGYIIGVACPTYLGSHLYVDRSLSNSPHHENVTTGGLYPDLDFLCLNSNIPIRYSITQEDARLPIASVNGKCNHLSLHMLKPTRVSRNSSTMGPVPMHLDARCYVVVILRGF